jgi:hypothetical protein
MIDKNNILNYTIAALFISIFIIGIITFSSPRETKEDYKKIKMYENIFIGLVVSLLSVSIYKIYINYL